MTTSLLRHLQGGFMKPKAAGTLSGCIVWIIAFGMLVSTILPIAIIVGMFTSMSDFATQTLGPAICPDGTTAESYSYPTTTTDEYGLPRPTTAYELHCVDANGVVVKNDTGLFVIWWIGIFVLIGLVIAALLAFVLAVPAGVIITRMLTNRQKSDISTNIEPE
jgi:hypothetical protein